MADQGILDELQTLIDFDTWDYVYLKDLTPQQFKDRINSFMFLKHKFGMGNTLKAIKARLVAGGHQQDLSNIDPENISSSTLRTASYNVLLNFAAYHKMGLSIIDIKSAYLHAKLPDDVVIHMTINKEITDMIVIIDPKALKFVDNKGECRYKSINNECFNIDVIFI